MFTKHTVRMAGMTAVIGALSGVLGSVAFTEASGFGQETSDDLIAAYYFTETAVTVSPHELVERMDAGEDLTIVDLRTEGAYNAGHIIGAINIPGDMPAEKIASAFAQLDQSQDIIVHCYSETCMLGRQVGAMLAKREIYVKHLGVGWAEWPEEAGDAYITSGTEPGVLAGAEDAPETCSIDGDFGC